MTTTVSGTIAATYDDTFAGLTVTLERLGGVVGFNGGAIAPDQKVYTTAAGGVLTMSDLKVGNYRLTLFVPVNEGTSLIKAWEVDGSVPSDAPSAMSLEQFLAKNAGPVTSSILQQAIDAKNQAEAFGRVYQESDEELAGIIIPAGATIVTRYRKNTSSALTDAAPLNEISQWVRWTIAGGSPSDPSWTDAAGETFVQRGFTQSLIISALNSAIAGIGGSGFDAFENRAAVLQWIADNPSPPVGKVLTWDGVGVRYIGSGTIIADMPGWVPNAPYYDPGVWGADYTGTNDSTAAIQAATTAAAGLVPVKTGKGTLKWDGTVTCPHSNQIFDFGVTVLDGSDFAGWISANHEWNTGRNKALLEPRGVLIADNLELDADADEGDTVVTISDATDLEPGDILTLRSDGQLWYAHGAENITRRDVNRVSSVSGNDVTLSFPLKMPFDATNHTVTVHIVRPVKNIKALGGIWEGGGLRTGVTQNGFGPCAFNAEGLDGVVFSPKEVRGWQNKAFAGIYLLNYEVSNCRIQGHEDDFGVVTENVNSGFYAIFPNWSRYGSIRRVYGVRTRHLLDGINTFDVDCRECVPIQNHTAAYTAHPGCSDWTIDLGHDSPNIDNSLNWRGFNLTVSGGKSTAEGPNGRSIFCRAAGGSANDMPSTLRFHGVSSRSENPSLLIGESNYRLIEIEGCDLESDIAPVTFSAFSVDTFRVRGGRLATEGSRCIQRQVGGTAGSGGILDVQGVTMEGYTSEPINLFTDVENIDIAVKGCQLIPGVGGESSDTVVYGNRTDGVWDVGPNYRGGDIIEAIAFDDIAVPVFGATDLKDRELIGGVYQYAAADIPGGPESAGWSHTMFLGHLNSAGQDRRAALDIRTVGSSNLRAWVGATSSATGAFFWDQLLTGSAAADLPDHADDATAASNGVAVGEFYRTGSIIKVRIA